MNPAGIRLQEDCALILRCAADEADVQPLSHGSSVNDGVVGLAGVSVRGAGYHTTTPNASAKVRHP
jgi:hypothetical protein